MNNLTASEELEYAIEKADCVYIPSQTMVVLRYEWDGEHKQLFCQSAHGGAIKEGWENPDGSTPEGVESGKYYVADENNVWRFDSAYWQRNQDTNSPYEVSDFEIDEEGKILSRYN